MTYAEKMLDSRWRKRRAEILHRDGYQCRRCLNSRDEATLNVHHLHYLPNHEPWEYEDDDLVTVCQPCHKAITYFNIPAEEIYNKWITYERIKGSLPAEMDSFEYQDAILRISNILLI